MKKVFFVLLVFLNGCSFNNSNPNNPDYNLPTTIDSQTKISMEGLNAFNTKGYVADIKSWFKYILIKQHKIVIDNITLSDPTKRVDDKGNSEIKPDYSESADIVLNINGKFDKDVVKSENIMFKNESGLIQLSYVGEILPRTKILIDDSIMLETRV